MSLGRKVDSGGVGLGVDQAPMDERSLQWERRFDWPMVIAALLVIPLLVIEEGDFGQPWDAIGVILN